MSCGFCGACEGQALALRGLGRVFFVARGPVPRDRSLILFILCILAILLQTKTRGRRVFPTLARACPSPYDKVKDTVARGPVPRMRRSRRMAH